MVIFLLIQHDCCTEYPCFLCLWESCAKDMHWTQKAWPERKNLQIDWKNIINKPLVPRGKIIFLSLLIKIVLMKQCIKDSNKKERLFRYLCNTFPGLSQEKLKTRIIDGSQIQKTIRDKDFTTSMTNIENRSWMVFLDMVKHFLRNRKAKTYRKYFVICFPSLNCMSIKVHFLILENLSDEHRECFHQEYCHKVEITFKESITATCICLIEKKSDSLCHFN